MNQGKITLSDEDRKAFINMLNDNKEANTLEAWWERILDQHIFVPPVMQQ